MGSFKNLTSRVWVSHPLKLQYLVLVFKHYTLLVLIDFCPVYSKLTWSLVYKNFWYFTKNYYGMTDLGWTFPHCEFLSLYLDMFDQNWSFLQKNEDFDKTYRLKNSKFERVIIHNIQIFCNIFQWNIERFSRQNSKLRIHPKPDRNQSKLTVCALCGKQE